MWSRSYRNHVIMAFPSFDTITNSWAPQADISWCAGPDRQSEFVRFQNRLMTENEAVSFALRRSVAWVNQRLKDLHRGPQAAYERGEKSIAALKDGLKRISSRQPIRTHAPLSQSPASTLTYSEFKSVMAKLGVDESEQSLHKSYAALVKLRKSHHCSWTEIKKKVEQSQEILTAPKGPSHGVKRSRLPLTPQSWRRIV